MAAVMCEPQIGPCEFQIPYISSLLASASLIICYCSIPSASMAALMCEPQIGKCESPIWSLCLASASLIFTSVQLPLTLVWLLWRVNHWLAHVDSFYKSKSPVSNLLLTSTTLHMLLFINIYHHSWMKTICIPTRRELMSHLLPRRCVDLKVTNNLIPPQSKLMVVFKVKFRVNLSIETWLTLNVPADLSISSALRAMRKKPLKDTGGVLRSVTENNKTLIVLWLMDVDEQGWCAS